MGNGRGEEDLCPGVFLSGEVVEEKGRRRWSSPAAAAARRGKGGDLIPC